MRMVLFMLMPSLVALDCATEIVSVTDEPHHHLVLTTPRVRVFDVRLAPREHTGLFAHLDRGSLYMDNLNINLGPTNINLVPQASSIPCAYPRRRCGSAAHRLALHDGDVWFRSSDDGVEMIDNDSGPTYHSVAIDFISRSTGVVPCDTACVDPTNASITRVMTADQWVVSSVILPPSGRVDVHDAVTVAVSTVDLAYNGSFARGDPGTVHRVHGTITNVGSRDARFILLEFLPIHGLAIAAVGALAFPRLAAAQQPVTITGQVTSTAGYGRTALRFNGAHQVSSDLRVATNIANVGPTALERHQPSACPTLTCSSSPAVSQIGTQVRSVTGQPRTGDSSSVTLAMTGTTLLEGRLSTSSGGSVTRPARNGWSSPPC